MMDTEGRTPAETTEEATRRMLAADGEAGSAYLRRSWILEAVRELREARRRLGMTQGQIAEKLQTTQSAIARMESDHDGRLSLHRYIDYAVACGVMPLDISLAPIEDVLEYAVAKPDANRTHHNFETWCRSRQVWTSHSQQRALISSFELMSGQPQSIVSTVVATREAGKGHSLLLGGQKFEAMIWHVGRGLNQAAIPSFASAGLTETDVSKTGIKPSNAPPGRPNIMTAA